MSAAPDARALPSVYFTAEHELLRAQVRRFVEREVRDEAARWETQGVVPRAVLRKMGALGMLGIRYPERYGGSALDTLATVVLAEELGRSTFGGFAITVLVHTDMASPHLANAGSQAQKERYLGAVIAGESITAVAITEPDAGSDVAAIRTRATRHGDRWVIEGTKTYITNGVHADLYFVAAKTAPGVGRSRAMTMFIVEKGTPGLRVARTLEKTGWRSSDAAELVFDACELGEAQVLGKVDRGFYAIMRNFQNERIVLAAQAIGEASRALEITLEHVRTRRAFGATLWDKQAIRLRLAQRMAEVEAARQLVYHAAWLDTRNIECTREVSMAKAVCAELVNRVMYDCQQFHGGAGYMQGATIERMARDARVHSIGGGATEVMLEEVAKRI